MDNKKSGAGFTFLETILAIFILATGIVGILAMFPVGIQTESTAKMKSCASELAQAKIEGIMIKSYEEINSSIEDYGEILGFESYKRITEVNYYDPVSSATSQLDSGIKEIDVKVFWKSGPGFLEKNIDFKLLISKK